MTNRHASAARCPAILLRRAPTAVAPADPADAGDPTSCGSRSSTRRASSGQFAAVFGFRLAALSALPHEARLHAQELLLARLGGSGGSGSLPGWSRALEVRYVVTPPDPACGRSESVDCYLIARLSGWASSARVIRQRAERYAASVLDLLATTLPTYRFEPLSTEAAVRQTLQPFRVRDLVEVRRQHLALSSSPESVVPLPLQGVPDAAFLVELLLRQAQPSILTFSVEPLASAQSHLDLSESPEAREDALVSVSRPDHHPHGSDADEPETFEALAAAYEDFAQQRQQAQRATALRMGRFHLRIAVASAGELNESVPNTLVREVGGPGRLVGGTAWRDPSLALATGADYRRPRSARLTKSTGQGSEFAGACENVERVAFARWESEARAPAEDLGDPSPYLADLGEVSRCFALPADAPWLPAHGIALPLPFRAQVSDGLRLGVNSVRGTPRPVFLPHASRPFHTWVLGVTGAGKSTLLERMILQDIEAGRGVIAIDPHGDLIRHILGRIPEERVGDVILFDPADKERPLGLNPLEVTDEEERDRVISDFILLLTKLYDPHHMGIIGPRFEHGARNVMATVMSVPGTTLVEVLRAFQDDTYVNTALLPHVTDPLVRRYWTDQIQATNSFHRSEVLDWLVSKFSHFVTDRTMRRILGQSASSFSFREAMDSGKIVLLSLAKGLVGAENANFLGLILLPMVLHAALSRAALPEEQRRDVSLYIDEFQNYATDSLALMLAEARKYRMALTLANQHVGQLTTDIRDAIVGNVGSIISFRLGAADALTMEAMLAPSPVHAQELAGLPDHTAYARLLVNGQRSPTFTLETEPVAEPFDAAREERVRAASRERYGRARAEVEAEINERAQLTEEPAKVRAIRSLNSLFT